MSFLSTKGVQNPYLLGASGRKEWNDRYLNLRQSIRMWQMGFLATSLLLVVFGLVMAKMAFETKLRPFIVETNQGMPYAVKALNNTNINDERIINFAVNQFIINTRTVLADPEAEEVLLKRAHAFSSGKVSEFLADYYEKNFPYELQKHKTISVNIANSMPISASVYQVVWDETEKNLTGNEAPIVSRYIANISYQFGEVSEAVINENPFGLYITDVTWSKSRTN